MWLCFTGTEKIYTYNIYIYIFSNNSTWHPDLWVLDFFLPVDSWGVQFHCRYRPRLLSTSWTGSFWLHFLGLQVGIWWSWWNMFGNQMWVFCDVGKWSTLRCWIYCAHLLAHRLWRFVKYFPHNETSTLCLKFKTKISEATFAMEIA